MSEDSNNFYLNKWTETYKMKLDSILIVETDFEAINNLLPYPSDELKTILKHSLKQLTKVTHFFIPNITIHQTIDEIFQTEKMEVQIIHPITLTLKKIDEKNIKEVMVFGSAYTMEKGYLSKQFEQQGISVSFPNKADHLFIDACRKAIYNRKATDEMLNQFNKILTNYAKKITIILACTELSIANKIFNAQVYDVATIQLQSAAAICKNLQNK